MTRSSHVPLPGDCYRLPSRLIVRVLEVTWRDGQRIARCVADSNGKVMHFADRFLVNHAWRMA